MDQNRRAPSQEYLLQGSVLDDSVDILLHRLRGMCDNSEEGLIKFKEHEITYVMREVSVRVRKQLHAPDQPYTLCYIGNPEIGNRPTTVRTCVEVNCTQNVSAFLQELGFTVDYEFIRYGWLFKRNRLKATVAKICRVEPPTPISRSHLVEVSTISSSSNEQAATEIQSFSEQLKPLVSLDKIDPRRLGM